MTHKLFDLSGKVSIVSGAAQGMGKEMSIGFAEAGSDVILVDINNIGAEDTANDISKLGVNCIVVKCDVSDTTQILDLYKTVDKKFNKIDIVANVAGPGGPTAPPAELDISQLEKVVNALVIGRFVSCQEAGKRMIKNEKGSIINFGSIGGWSSLGRGHTAYGMSMGATIQMTRELSTEWASKGVRVNAILPAQVWNSGLRERIKNVPELEETFIGGIPMGRLGEPHEIKGPAIFLASDASSFVTGAILPMDGGNLALNAGGTYPGSPRVYA
ncbi:MAG: short-chain dehydrogenase [Chloroflexi bacterium]|nr:short-chain dehydrogenase [Chloroflexota bacterium]